MQDVVCPLPDYALGEITTFKAARDEREWLADPQTAKCPQASNRRPPLGGELIRGPVIKSDIF
jgi:hypothetical protein